MNLKELFKSAVVAGILCVPMVTFNSNATEKYSELVSGLFPVNIKVVCSNDNLGVLAQLYDDGIIPLAAGDSDVYSRSEGVVMVNKETGEYAFVVYRKGRICFLEMGENFRPVK